MIITRSINFIKGYDFNHSMKIPFESLETHWTSKVIVNEDITILKDLNRCIQQTPVLDPINYYFEPGLVQFTLDSFHLKSVSLGQFISDEFVYCVVAELQHSDNSHSMVRSELFQGFIDNHDYYNSGESQICMVPLEVTSAELQLFITI